MLNMKTCGGRCVNHVDIMHTLTSAKQKSDVKGDELWHHIGYVEGCQYWLHVIRGLERREELTMDATDQSA